MKKIITLCFIAIVGLTSSCSKERFPDASSIDAQGKVIMSFDIKNAASSQGGLTRAASAIEDKIDKVATLVFDSNSGDKLYSTISSDKLFILTMKPGLYDFYFLANVPDLERLAEKFYNSQSLNAYMLELQARQEIDAASKTLIPLSRVYLNQKIEAGGTAMTPLPFKPQIENINEPLAPVSKYPVGFAEEPGVNLLRSYAKVSLALKGYGLKYVKKVEFMNRAEQFSFSQNRHQGDMTFTYSTPFNIEELKRGMKQDMYVPETVFDRETVRWDYDEETGQGWNAVPVNFIQITMADKKVYRIPIISNNYRGADYLKFAKTNKTEVDFNVVRNYNYNYTITISSLQGIAVDFEVLPWNVVKSEKEFYPAEVTATLSQADGTNIEIDTNHREVVLKAQACARVKLKFKKPKGGVLKVALTNGADFSVRAATNLVANEVGATHAIINVDKTYVFEVFPTKPFDKKPRFTQLYITVNNKEVSLLPGVGEEQSGVNNRVIVKQVE